VSSENEEFIKKYEALEFRQRVATIILIFFMFIQLLSTIQQVTGLPINVILYIISLKLKEIPIVLKAIQFLHPYIAIVVFTLLILDYVLAIKRGVFEEPNIGVTLTIALIQINLCLMEFFWTGYITYIMYTIYYIVTFICAVIVATGRRSE